MKSTKCKHTSTSSKNKNKENEPPHGLKYEALKKNETNIDPILKSVGENVMKKMFDSNKKNEPMLKCVHENTIRKKIISSTTNINTKSLRLPLNDITVKISSHNHHDKFSSESNTIFKDFKSVSGVNKKFNENEIYTDSTSELNSSAAEKRSADIDLEKYEYVTFKREYEDHPINSADFSFLLENNLKGQLGFVNIVEQTSDEPEKSKTDVSNCTPTNNNAQVFPLMNIKKIRRNILQTGKIVKNSIGYEDNLDEIGCNDKNLAKQDKCILNIHRKPGAVLLDQQENYVFHNVLYSYPYFNYIIEYQLGKEVNFEPSENFLNKYNITSYNRSIVINWLIKLQTYMKVDHNLVYMAVRLMDRTIDSEEIPLNMLQLVILASFWIALKYNSADHKMAGWMVKQSGGAYTNAQLLEMEQKVLRRNNFVVDGVDLSAYIHYYVLNMQISNSNTISQCAHYLLDCALLDGRFARIRPSTIAAGAIYASLTLMKQFNGKAWEKLRLCKWFVEPERLESVKMELIEILKEVNDPDFECREPFHKFSSGRYCGVARLISDMLSNEYK